MPRIIDPSQDGQLCSSALVLIDPETQNVKIFSFLTYECIVVCSPVMSYRSLICISFKLTVHVKGKKMIEKITKKNKIEKKTKKTTKNPNNNV